MPSSLSEFFSAESPLNPGWFNYGTLPLILLAVIGWVGDQLREIADFIPNREVLWRGATGLADAATVVLIVHIGRELYGRTAGFLAAALYALAVLPIQLSHYYAVDPLMTALLMGSLLASIRFLQSRDPRTGYLAAALLGLAISTKAAALVFAIPVVFVWLVYLWIPIRNNGTADDVRIALRRTILAALIAFAAFAVAQPYALIDFSTYMNDVMTQANMARGDFELPFTIQYQETTPWVYHLRNLVIWGLGIPLGVAALAGTILIAWRAARQRNTVEIIFIAALLIPFLWLGMQQVKFMRYLLPLYPLLGIAAAFAILSAMAYPDALRQKGSVGEGITHRYRHRTHSLLRHSLHHRLWRHSPRRPHESRGSKRTSRPALSSQLRHGTNASTANTATTSNPSRSIGPTTGSRPKTWPHSSTVPTTSTCSATAATVPSRACPSDSPSCAPTTMRSSTVNSALSWRV